MGTADAVSQPKKITIPWGLFAGLLVLFAIMMLPTPEGLSTSGHRMLAILTFAVIVWLTEAVSYEVSSLAIVALIALLVGLAPTVTLDAAKEFISEDPAKWLGTSKGMGMALSGFSNGAWALVAGATFLAAAMTYTGLDRRIALITLNVIGTSTKRILIGVIVVTIILSLFVPSATARVACIVPIMSGIIAAYGVEKRSRIAVGIMILIAQATSVWNVGIQTSAAQNLLTVGFMQTSIGQQVSWGQWLIAGGPWSVLMSFVLYFVVLKMMPPEADNIPGGKEAVAKELKDLGRIPGPQIRLLTITCILLFFWATGGGTLHRIDTTTSTTVGLVIMMLPGIGVISWKEVQKRTPWGTILVFGVGISLGSALLNTGAGKWLGDWVVESAGLASLSPFMIFTVLSAFLIVIHLGFASATALTSLFMPIMIVMFHTIGTTNLSLTPDIQLGLSMLLGFVVSYGFILPVNAPQNMVCMATETFTPTEFSKMGIVVTIIGYLLMLLMALFYWPLLGWL
ncbi:MULTISPECIES: DASS family sodium-coupled anion symporter [unclassified Bartonella]|uniref:DASS family sodium-coupled anion symporter n=1 Tax=unclassified Bartonella TaxID=2645622 RepID=UPI0015FC8A17|nr:MULTISPECIES: DASS family sodium-coupled anion symporter [unclassified Bartonella]UXN03796.1 anion permease [Bartonella sp. HY406]